MATAARVIGGYGRVSAATRARVTRAATELNYHPSAVARSMIKGRTDTVAVIVSDNSNPFFAAVIKGIETAVLPHRYSLLLFNADEDPEKEELHFRTILEKRVDGVILSPSGSRPEALRALLAHGISIVEVDRRANGIETDAVLIDNRAGVAAGIRHLLDLGHTRLGIISGPRRHFTGRERLEGYLETLRRAGLAIENGLILEGNFKEESGYTLAGEVLRIRPRPTAVLVANNLMTIGALLRWKEAGVRIPQELSVVGFDDMDWAPILTPPLTTIAQPGYNLGTAAAQLLLDRLRSNRPGRPQTILFQPRLIVRESTAPPAGPPAMRRKETRRRASGRDAPH